MTAGPDRRQAARRGSRWRRAGVAAATLIAAIIAVAGTSLAVAAADGSPQPGSTTAELGSLRLTVSRVSDLDPEGDTVEVRGAGYDETRGIYVAFCVDNGPGVVPSPCGGGIDTAGTSGSSVWISSDPPPYGRGLAVPYDAGGAFAVSLRVSGTFKPDIDCAVARCAIVTRNDHTRSQDRGQDLAVPLTFRAPTPIVVRLLPWILGAAALVVGLAWLVRRWRRRHGSPPPTAGLAVMALASILVLAACQGPGAGAAGRTAAVDPAAACGPRTAVVADSGPIPLTPAPTPDLPVTVTSTDGRSVTITDVSRILPVNLYGSIAEIVFSLGLGDRVVGRDTSTTFAAAAALPNVTAGGHDLSAESVLALDPTVIIADSSIGPPAVVDQLRDAGIPVVLIDDEQTVANVPVHIRSIAAALGVPAAGEELLERVQAEIDAAAPTDPLGLRVAFLYVRGSAGVYLISGDGAGPDDMIEGIGDIDAGTELGFEGFRPITTEALIDAAPDVILVMTDGLASVGGVEGLLEQPGVGQTPAGQHRRIVDMDDGLLLNFGARTGAAMAALAAAIHDPCG